MVYIKKFWFGEPEAARVQGEGPFNDRDRDGAY